MNCGFSETSLITFEYYMSDCNYITVNGKTEDLGLGPSVPTYYKRQQRQRHTVSSVDIFRNSYCFCRVPTCSNIGHFLYAPLLKHSMKHSHTQTNPLENVCGYLWFGSMDEKITTFFLLFLTEIQT